MVIEKFSKGDKILFDERTQPLKVAESEDDRIIVEGPKGGQYEIYEAENGKLLYCKEGKRRYSSYVENLRKVGEWSKENNKWIHSKTEAEIKLVKNEAGFWTIKTEKIDLEPIEPPKYGYSDKESAEKDVKKLIKKNPEG